jgi:hypothetical protein
MVSAPAITLLPIFTVWNKITTKRHNGRDKIQIDREFPFFNLDGLKSHFQYKSEQKLYVISFWLFL